jgi:oxygen-dependent protoporphyrinogen oxidase
MAKHVLVIGGGITGLAAAHRLLVRHPELAVTLVEGDTRLGGKILTVDAEGYTLEGGPDSMLGSKPRGIGLARELGLEDRLIGPTERNRRSFVLRRGRLHRIPEGLTGLVPTKLKPLAKSSLISPLGKARMLGDFVRRPRRDDGDESLEAFMTRRLGGEVYANLIEPLMAGIYAGDGSALSVQATFPQLRQAEREHGGLIRGVLAQRAKVQQPANGTRPGFITLQTGLRELVDALAADIEARGGEIRLGAAVTLLERCGTGYRATLDRDDGPETMRVDGAIVATQAWAAAPLLDGLDRAAALALEAIPHVSSAIVALGFDDPSVEARLRGFGYVVPRAEKRAVMAMTWLSSKWAGRAPAGKALIRAFVGRAGQQELLERPDDELVTIVRRELAEVLGITAEPELVRVFRWDGGMPQYALGHLDRVEVIEDAVSRLPGIAVAGNMLRGVGLPDCIASGERAADTVAAEVITGTPVAASLP